MKTIYTVAAVVITIFIGILVVQKPDVSVENSLAFSPDRISSDREDRTVEQVEASNPSSALNNGIRTYGKFLSKNLRKGVIGIGTDFDEPSDNIFHVNLSKVESSARAFLVYKLFGLKQGYSLEMGVNDELSSGGIYFEESDEWTEQRIQLPISSIREGLNTIRFDLPDSYPGTCIVEDVAIVIEPGSSSSPEVVIDQQSINITEDGLGYISGFVRTTKSICETVEIAGQSVNIKKYGSFEHTIDISASSNEPEFVKIKVELSNGKLIEKAVPLGYSENGRVIQNALYNTRTVYGVFNQNTSIDLSLYNFNIQGSAGFLSSASEISITGLREKDVLPMEPSMINVTGDYSGYRLLPHNSQFKSMLRIAIPYDSKMIPKGYNAQYIRSYFFDEQNGKWVQLPLDTIDTKNHVIYSYTDHFTDFVNGVIQAPEAPQTNAYTPTTFSNMQAVNPLGNYNLISPPKANNDGTANLSFPIQIPAGRNGMQPNLNITYSSGRGTGWLGIGWNLSLPSIEVDDRWGVPRYDPTLETESYLISGAQLLPLVQSGKFVQRVADKTFDRRVEGKFDKIVRKGNSPDTYTWEVTDINGTTYYYGKYSGETSVNSNLVLTDDQGNIAFWALAEVKDQHGNYIKYTYQKVNHPGYAGSSNMGRQIYPESITYTGFNGVDGKYTVDFTLDASGSRPDIRVSARKGFKEVTANRLAKIRVEYNNDFVREYRMQYQVLGNFSPVSGLCHIIEINDEKVFSNSYSMDFLSTVSCEAPDPSEKISGVRIHGFEYNSDIDKGFDNGVTISVDSWFSDVFGNPLDDDNFKRSVGRSRTLGYSFQGGLGIGGQDGMNFWESTSLCGNFSYAKNFSKTKEIHMDLNSDGLPDRIRTGGVWGNKVYFRKLSYDETNDEYVFGNSVEITGLESIGKSNTKTVTIGGEAIFSPLGAGYSNSKSETYTAHYFADVNGDGFVDYINGDEILVNNPDANGIPVFTTANSSNITIAGDACYQIIHDQGIDEDIDDLGENALPELYDRDLVRMWRAPYSGKIKIKAPIRLTEDLSSSNLQNIKNDGIRYTIQHEDNEITADEIDGTDFTWHTPTNLLSEISVTKGDQFYFRIQSNGYRDYDHVRWNPYIYYVEDSEGQPITDTTVLDADNKHVYTFMATRDDFVYDEYSYESPHNGTIYIDGYIDIEPQSDDVEIRLIKETGSTKTTIGTPITVSSGQSQFCTLGQSVSVNQEDKLYYEINSNSSIDVGDIRHKILFKYLEFEDAQGAMCSTDTTFYLDNLNKRVQPKFVVYQDILQENLPNLIPETGNYEITVDIDGLTGQITSGDIVLSVKKEKQLLAERLVTVSGMPSTLNTSLSVNLNAGDKVYFELSVLDPSLADQIVYAEVKGQINGQTETFLTGVNACMDADLWKFGNLYRGWGQFSYLDPGFISTNPIDQSRLDYNDLYNNNNIASKDAYINNNDITDFSSCKSFIDQGGNNVPSDVPFNKMSVDQDSMVWRDYAKHSKISGRKMTLTQIKIDNDETFYETPIIKSSKPGYVPTNVALRNTGSSDTWSLKTGIDNKAITTGEGEQDILYMDLNGDRFPDVVSLAKQKAQYTGPWGGYAKPNAQLIESNVTISMSKTIHSGISYSVSTKNHDKIEPEGPQTKKKEVFKTSSAGGSGTTSDSYTKATLVDVNGDGLPDKVHESKGIALNYGYGFYDYEVNNSLNLGVRESEAVGFSGTTGTVTQMQNELFQTMEYSWSVGLGKSYNWNREKSELADVNGDGLIDIMYVTTDKKLMVLFNNGTGFEQPYEYLDNVKNIERSKTVSFSGHAAGTFGIPVWVVKLTVNGSIGGSAAVTYEDVALIDMNNDGFLDLMYIDVIEGLMVKFHKQVNDVMLKKVHHPTNSYFTIDYEQTNTSIEMPSRRWVMSAVDLYDGLADDGLSHLKSRYTYEGGYYDRAERSFMGFEVVKNQQIKWDVTPTETYRETVSEYHNDEYLFKGLKHKETVYDANGNKYIESLNHYDRIEVTTGNIVPSGYEYCFDSYYPAITEKYVLYYEGEAAPKIVTRQVFDYGSYGKFDQIIDYKDVNIAEDDVRTQITYQPDDLTKYIRNKPDEIKVYHGLQLLRKRTAEYDQLGNLTKVTSYNGAITAETDLTYDSYGNIESITYPRNSNNQRMNYEYEYDAAVHTYPVLITDAFNNTSTSTFDYRIGKPLSTTDVAGNTVQYTYYGDGRPKFVRGPYEIEEGIDYLIKYEYFDRKRQDDQSADSIPWARTIHYDPMNEQNTINTILFTDGIGNPVQTKKTGFVDDNNVLIVSGINEKDAFQRVIASYYPTLSNPEPDSIYMSDRDNITATAIEYDILDRKTKVITPDNTTNTVDYGFGYDAYLETRFRTKTVDGNGATYYSLKDTDGNQTTLKAPTGVITSFKYSPIGELKESMDPEGNITNYTYDMLGRLVERDHPDAGVTSYTYDKANNLLTLQTAELAGSSQSIEYAYDYNRLMEIEYPENPVNNVYYYYGISGNQTGRLARVQSASGIQTFSYGKLGELTESKSIFVLPDEAASGNTYQFTTSWDYDSWNRIKSIEYPDGEKVSYEYNVAGQLTGINSIKSGAGYTYLDNVHYDKFGSKVHVDYGNNTEETYIYDATLHRLSGKLSKDGNNQTFQDLSYSYDNVGNIDGISNSAQAVNSIGGEYNYSYQYDSLYRLTSAEGDFLNNDYDFTLEMGYTPSGNILTKDISVTGMRNGVTFVKDYSNDYYYSSVKPHAIDHIYESNENVEYGYDYDNNGNMLMQQRPDVTEAGRRMCWDEENRIRAIKDNRALSGYVYNAGGERVWKFTGYNEQMMQNGDVLVDMVNLENKTLYASPYMVVDNAHYTKHYYSGSQRIASKIGSGFADAPVNPLEPVEVDEFLVDDAQALSAALWNYLMESFTCAGLELGDLEYEPILYSINELANETGNEPGRFYYHSDHLGSSAFISNASGELEQHLQYLPFGEDFIEQHVEWQTRYTFSGKEKDRMTDFSYFGARYYDSEVSVWLSVDPLADQYPSTSAYMYVLGKPTALIDPDGTSTWVVDNGDGTYKVVGGNLEDKDKGIYIVTQNRDGTYSEPGECIGESLTMFSFYNEDKQDGEDQVGWKGTIDINSTESADLVQGFMEEADNIELPEYMENATDGKKYDFKRSGDPENNDREYHHRGSEFYTKEDGTKVYASARDAGNFSAGFYAASKGLSWKQARFGFDGLEKFKSAFKGHFVSGEGRQSTHAQALGFARRKFGMNVGPSKK